MPLWLQVTSTPDREGVFVEVWSGNSYVAEGYLTDAGDVNVRFRPAIDADFPAAEWIRVIRALGAKLERPPDGTTSSGDE